MESIKEWAAVWPLPQIPNVIGKTASVDPLPLQQKRR